MWEQSNRVDHLRGDLLSDYLVGVLVCQRHARAAASDETHLRAGERQRRACRAPVEHRSLRKMTFSISQD